MRKRLLRKCIIGLLLLVMLATLTLVGSTSITQAQPPQGTVQIIVKFKSSNNSTAFAAAVRGSDNITPVAPAIRGSDNIASIASAVQASGGKDLRDLPQLRTHVISVPASAAANVLAALENDPSVERATKAVKFHQAGTPDDPEYIQQWALPKIAWDQVYGTTPIAGSATIAVLDTGVDAGHPDLAGRMGSGQSFVNGDANSDPNGHGTALAGIAAANVNNAVGVAGVAYAGVTVSSVQVLQPDGTGLDSDVIAGVVWAVDNGANVILMGFSSADYSAALEDALQYAWSNGAVLVAATGNDSSSAPSYPAGMENVLGVASTDQDDNVAAYSNTGSACVAAPGSDIYTTMAGGNYGSISGTSAAAAETAGLAALLVASGQSNAYIYDQVRGAVDPITGQSFGRINVATAMGEAVTPPPSPVPEPPPTPGPTPPIYAPAATRTSAQTGNWNQTTTWVGGVVPVAGDAVIIATGHNVTVNANTAALLSINIQSGATLTMGAGARNVLATTISVSGTIVRAAASTGTLPATGVTFNSGGLYDHRLTTTAGTIPTATWSTGSTCLVSGYTTNTGNLAGFQGQTFYNFTWNCPGQTGAISLSSAATYTTTINGNFTVVTTNTGVLHFRKTGVAAVPTININGDLIIQGGTVDLQNAGGGSATITTLNLAGNFNMTGGTFQTSTAVSGASAVLNFTGANKTFTQSGGTFNGGSSRININVNTPASLTLANNIPTLTSYGVTVNSGGTLNCSTLLVTGTGFFTLNSGGTLGIGSTAGITSSGATGNIQVTGTRTYNSGANYTYNGIGAQVTGNGLPIAAITGSVTISNSSDVTLTNSLIANGTLTVNGLLGPTATLTVSGTGTLTGSGTAKVTRTVATADFSSQYTITNKTLTNLTVEYNGAGAQTVSALTYGHLKINNSNGVTLAGNVNVGGTLTLSSGKATTGANTLIIAAGGAISGGGASSYVNGKLQKSFNTGSGQSFTFPIGDGSSYTWVNLASMNVGTSGSLTVSTTAGDHLYISTSGIDSTKSVNRYWTLTPGGSFAATYNATFNYPTGDVDGGALASSFIVRQYSSSTWSVATVSGTPTTTATTISGQTGFGDFAIGDPAAPTVTSVTPYEGTQGATLYNVIIAGTYFTDATSVSFGAGITVNDFNTDNTTQITANITIVPSAAPGARDVSVTTPGGTGTRSNGFTVLQAAPTVTSVTPNQGTQGATLNNVIVTGTYFTGATSVSFDAGITVNDFNTDNTTQITANITIASDATPGMRDVSVTTPGGTGTLSSGFTVLQTTNISFTVTKYSDNITFSNLDPGMFDHPADQNSPIHGAVTLEVLPDTNVAVDIQLMGSDFTGPITTIPIGNVKYNSDNTTSGASIMPSSYLTWYNVPAYTDNKTECYHWISIPAGEAPGSYASTFYFQAIKQP